MHLFRKTAVQVDPLFLAVPVLSTKKDQFQAFGTVFTTSKENKELCFLRGLESRLEAICDGQSRKSNHGTETVSYTHLTLPTTPYV